MTSPARPCMSSGVIGRITFASKFAFPTLSYVSCDMYTSARHYKAKKQTFPSQIDDSTSIT
eukprot:1035136-Pleurochrysis_carterae.AAC.2